MLAVYVVLLGVALLAPTNNTQSSMVVWLIGHLVDLGVSPRLVTFTRMEVLMNAVIVAPVSFLGSMLSTRFTWRDWTTAGFLGSVAVETTQAVLLPGRQASFSDVVANTVGALLGALVWRGVSPLMSRSGRRESGGEQVVGRLGDA